MMRHTGKQILTKRIGALALAAAAGLGLTSAVPAANSRINEAYVTDPLSGVALDGYDPVSYFTEGEPLLGRADYEYFWQGVSWYFANQANRDVFERNPESYAPQFGGYGAMSMARGFLSDGNPLIYSVLDNRLYVFYSFGNHDAFLAASATARINAIEKWNVLQTSLSRP